MAKIGLLYLNNGRYNGNQILSPEWVKQTFTKYSVVDGVDYGYLWRLKWLNAGGIIYHGMAAQGNGGQRIFLWPEQNMVTVITGGSYMEQSPSDQIVREFILPAFNKN